MTCFIFPTCKYHDDMAESAKKATETYEELNGPSTGYSGKFTGRSQSTRA